MTKQELLTAQGDELSRLLGEVLQPETKIDHLWEHRDAPGGYAKYCSKCGCNDTCTLKCIVADPIPLNDWNVAMKWRDWAVKEYGEVKFKQAMIDMYALEDEYMNMMFGVWFACYAQPEHYLIAAALCKLKGTK